MLTPRAKPPAPAPWREFVSAPLVPVAVAVGLGLSLDRYINLPLEFGVCVAVLGLLLWWALLKRSFESAPLALSLSSLGLAASYHHLYQQSYLPDDIGIYASDEPKLVRVRGRLLDDPVTRHATVEASTTWGTTAWDLVVLRVEAVAPIHGEWLPASGKVHHTVDRPTARANLETTSGTTLDGLRAGDRIETIGLLLAPPTSSNPGESNLRARLADQRIRAELHTVGAVGAVVRLDAGSHTLEGVIARVRSSASRVLHEELPEREAGIAQALLLGDGSAMEREQWDRFIRTGVVHALAISGQHLVVLAAFLWIVLRILGVRRRRGAWLILLVIVGYAVLTGLRPSGVRAAAMVSAMCGGLILRRLTLTANSFALSWLVVAAMNPTDPFSLGSRLSFLSVFVLIWGVGRWLAPKPLTPLEQLIEESRSLPELLLRRAVRIVIGAYLVTLAIWVANAPMLISDQNLVAPIGILIGPPIVLLTSIALISGFLLMLVASLGIGAWPFAEATRFSLAGCDALVAWAVEVPGGSVYLPGFSAVWLIGLYAGLFAFILLDGPWRRRCGLFMLIWFAGGMLRPGHADRAADELRVTFLAVGHGGCVVMETPDDRCLVYDAGSTGGPGMVRRVVAPYLWHRGIRRIDELFVSHADTDHFNGVTELARRFPIGQVTLTPSFAEAKKPEVAATLVTLDRHAIPVRVARAGDRFLAGELVMDVLHPPAQGPGTTENERSLVLLIEHEGNRLLLTGDLEKQGTASVLQQKSRQVDVMMAPHHGSLGASPDRLIRWCEPRFVVVSRGAPKGNALIDAPTRPPIRDTYSAGAVTVRSHRTGLIVDTFRTGERRVLPRMERK